MIPRQLHLLSQWSILWIICKYLQSVENSRMRHCCGLQLAGRVMFWFETNNWCHSWWLRLMNIIKTIYCFACKMTESWGKMGFMSSHRHGNKKHQILTHNNNLKSSNVCQNCLKNMISCQWTNCCSLSPWCKQTNRVAECCNCLFDMNIIRLGYLHNHSTFHKSENTLMNK